MTTDLSKHFKLVIDSLPLLEKDRESLKKKRGFTDDVINLLQFRSCGKDLLTQDLKEQIPSNIYNSLTKENILIPYLDLDRNVTHLRPHKFGIKGLEIRPYVLWPFYNSGLDTMVIAESEFKAVASCLYGVPAIGIPGISSFSRTHFDQLISIFSALNLKKIIICFDNEIKDNPEFDNYKSDITKRLDTQFYAYVTAKQIVQSGFKATIATLPASYMFQGKIDIDSALAKGMPKEAYHECLADAVDPETYRKSWKLKGILRSYIERKIDRWFYKGPIQERIDGYYYYDGEQYNKLSNFKINVFHTVYGNEGVERLCQFKSEYGDSDPVILSPEMMTSKTNFLKLCYANGDYEFLGTDPQLQKIWHFIFMNQSGKIVRKLTNYGYAEDHDMWFFENGGYIEDRFYPVNEEGIIWVDEVGYRLFDNLMEDLSAPKLTVEKPEFTIIDVYEKISQKIGLQFARLMLGWTLGNFFMPEIIKAWDAYPFLFLHGTLGSGKTTVANWISSFFGFNTQKGIPFSGSSEAGLNRITSQMGMIPVWLEEYRNKDQNIAKKNTLLRSIYDRSTIVKGTKKADEIKTYKARSTIILSGEETPNDAALNSRCMLFQIMQGNRCPVEVYEWIEANKSQFSYFGHEILTNKKKLWPQLKKNMEEYMESFKQTRSKLSDRTRLQMSIVAGICDVFLGESDVFQEFVGEFSDKKDIRVNSERALSIFWDDVINMYALGRLKDVSFFSIGEEQPFHTSQELRIRFGVLYAAWEQFFKNMRNDIPAQKQALLDHIYSEPYYIGRLKRRIGNYTGDVLCFNMLHDQFPEDLRNFFINIGDQNGGMPDNETVLDFTPKVYKD